MKEVEVKILEVNRKKIEATLTGLGAKKIFGGDILTIFFDFKDHRIVKAKDVLRIRKEQDKIELTYKKVHVTAASKNAEEYTVEVSNLETMKQILENMGLNVTEDMEKHRVSYMLNGARFDVDCYVGKYGFIPEFMEIEAESSDLIHKFANQLGFKNKDCVPWSTEELIQHYSPKKGKIKA